MRDITSCQNGIIRQTRIIANKKICNFPRNTQEASFCANMSKLKFRRNNSSNQYLGKEICNSIYKIYKTLVLSRNTCTDTDAAWLHDSIRHKLYISDDKMFEINCVSHKKMSSLNLFKHYFMVKNIMERKMKFHFVIL